MNLWQNPQTDLGQALTRQQQLMAHASGSRYFWLNLEQNIDRFDGEYTKTRLEQLLQQHQALSSYYGVPQGFEVIRQQQQNPRLDFRVYQHSVDSQVAAEQQAALVFDEQAPHLLVWCWPQQTGVKVLLAGSALTLDDHTAYKIYQLLDDAHLPIVEPEIQYNEYGQWINELLSDEDAQAGKDWWQGLGLNHLPEAQLNERLNESSNSTSNTFKSAAKNIKAIVPSTLQPTPQIVLTVWAALLGKLSGYDELKVHYFHDCRHDYEEFEPSLGLFAQPLPVPFYQLNSCNLEAACQGASALLEEMLEYQEYVSTIDNPINNAIDSPIDSPFDNPGQTCHAGFYWHEQQQLHQMSSDGLVSHCQLLLHYTHTQQGDAGLTLRYNSARYSEQAMQRLLQRYLILLDAALAQPTLPMQQLDCLLADERPKPVTPMAIEGNFVTLFGQQVQAFGDNMALTDGDNHYSYRQLNQLSNQYAAALQQAGAGKEQIVALCLPRNADLLVCLLAVLKTGAAYLPLDPEQPQARLQQIIDDAAPVVLVTELTTLATKSVLNIEQLQQTQATFKPVNIDLQQLAYVLYTSGSTGQPKGVQVEHQQLIHYSEAAIKQLALPRQSHYGLISTLVADLGNTMLFPGWLTASCVHLLGKNEANDGQALSRYCQHSPLDCLKIVPSHLEALLSAGEPQLLPTQVLVLGGEPVSQTLLTQLSELSQERRIYNHYGPTETTVGVLFGQIDLSKQNTRLTNSIGDSQIYLLDPHQQTTVSGQTGEVYIAGSSVTRGYLNDDKRTAQVYLDNPFSAGRMYRTGDLAIRHADNSIEIMGRSDHQVKIRGFRLELDEIQLKLSQYADIRQANVQVQGKGEMAKLLAFVIAAQPIDEPALLGYLAEYLPGYMVPNHIVQLTQFPLNANGKIDRKRLFELADKQQQQTIIPPQNAIETQLLTIWQTVLQQNNISVTDDFFALGGHSLAAIKVIAKIRQQMGCELANDLLFHHKTIRALAGHLQQNKVANPRLIQLAKADSEHTIAHTMVLMHSHTGHFNYHQTLINNLSSTTIFGLTPNPELIINTSPNDINDLLDDYIQQLLPLKATPLVLTGWSLGGKTMVLLAKRMQTLGFDITAVAIIDYDPAQQLNVNNDSQQLIQDFKDYIEVEKIALFPEQAPEKAPEQTPEQITQISQTLNGDYQQAMQQLLHHPAIKAVVGDELSIKALEQRFMMRWQFKQLLYQTNTPVIDIPLWVWRGNTHASPLEIWQKHSSLKMQGWFIDADHYDILNQPQLAEQLQDNMKNTKSIKRQKQANAQVVTES